MGSGKGSRGGSKHTNEHSWTKESPPPGRPKTPDANALVAAALEAEPGISEKLVALRVAANWGHKGRPKHGLTQFYLELRERSAKEFQKVWDQMEKEYEAAKTPRETPAVVAAAPVSLVAEGEEPLEATEGDEELRAGIVELLKRHEARAKG